VRNQKEKVMAKTILLAPSNKTKKPLFQDHAQGLEGEQTTSWFFIPGWWQGKKNLNVGILPENGGERKKPR